MRPPTSFIHRKLTSRKSKGEKSVEFEDQEIVKEKIQPETIYRKSHSVFHNNEDYTAKLDHDMKLYKPNDFASNRPYSVGSRTPSPTIQLTKNNVNDKFKNCRLQNENSYPDLSISIDTEDPSMAPIIGSPNVCRLGSTKSKPKIELNKAQSTFVSVDDDGGYACHNARVQDFRHKISSTHTESGKADDTGMKMNYTYEDLDRANYDATTLANKGITVVLTGDKIFYFC